jgi:hydroxypyruvate isomerase
MTLRYSANIGFLWDELALPDRISAAARAGFDAVECHFPYDHPAETIKQSLVAANIPMIGLNTALGPEGSFGLAAIAGEQNNARALIDQAIDYAATIGANNINVVAGLTAGAAAANTIYIENLQYACDKAAQHDKCIMIEPLNPRAVADYHFSSVEQAVQIIDSVGRDNMKLMFDFFHAQIVQGDLETLLKRYVDYFAHVQISAVHDRGEPNHGEIYFPYLLGVLEDAGYTGYIGAEYKPRGDSVESGLSWLEDFRGT